MNASAPARIRVYADDTPAIGGVPRRSAQPDLGASPATRSLAGGGAKGDVNEPFTFTAEDGHPLLLAPGTNWVERVFTDKSVDIN